MRNIADETLVTQVQEGNIGAFEELVRRYQRKLYRFVIRIVPEHHIAEDIVQEACIRLYTSIEQVDTTKKFSSYFYAITRNVTMTFLREKKHDVSFEKVNFLATEESPDTQLIRFDERHRVHQAIASLNTKYKKVISLYYFENLSYEEISRKLKFPINTVRTHLKRAKEALRKILT